MPVIEKVGVWGLVRPLGEGSFARTYEAKHELLQTRACIKIARQPRDNDSMLAEARMLWDLHHPSLPTVRDALLTPSGTLALVLRFVEGTTLERRVLDHGPLPVEIATPMLGRLLRALRLVHHRGIVHNDVKPANIIVEPDLTGVVLVDFGVSSARPGARSVAPGLTPAFAAPEVAMGHPPLPESDLYSLGLTMLWALGADIDRRTLPAGVPDDFLDLLVRLTRRDASKRPRWETDNPMRRLQEVLATR